MSGPLYHFERPGQPGEERENRRRDDIGGSGTEGRTPAFGIGETSPAYVPSRGLQGEALKDWDAGIDFGRFVVERAGLRFALDQRQTLTVGETTLTVSLWLDTHSLYVLRVHDGWPTPRVRRALCLAELYQAAVTGELPTRERSEALDAELARWKRRALVDGGFVEPAAVGLPPLPPDATPAARATWRVIEHLLSVRWLTDDPTEPFPLVAPFLARWANGVVADFTEATARVGKTWLERHGRIERAGHAPSRFGKPTVLWRITPETKTSL